MGKSYYFPVTKTPEEKIPSPSVPKPRNIQFSFKYFDPKHKTCKKAGFPQHYPKELLKKFQQFEKWTETKFKTYINDQHYRIHKIKWTEPRVAYGGFGLDKEFDADAWQFSISAQKYGRVCGFFIDNLFFIVWLDPSHTVYPHE